jgi:hypothetical protein
MSRRWNLAWAALLTPCVYSASYAPMARLTDGESIFWDAYNPVNSLIDNSPLREPLLLWARCWCVEGVVDLCSQLRAEFEIHAASHSFDPDSVQGEQ